MEIKYISIPLKIRLFNCILLYNAVTWIMNKTLTKALLSGYNRLLRYALNIRWIRGVHQPTNALNIRWIRGVHKRITYNPSPLPYVDVADLCWTLVS